jgi:antibiotic biosynthesis monooxygenase (ABM) superfamily enzyme
MTTTATIDAEDGLVTLINAHACRPEDQERLVALLLDAAENAYRHLPGFVSASIHKSADGIRVTNYAQYRTREAVAAIQTSPAVRQYIERIRASGLVTGFEGHAYAVAGVVTPPEAGHDPDA